MRGAELLDTESGPRAGVRSDEPWTQPKDGQYCPGAHGALPSEPAGGVGECTCLPVPWLVAWLLSRLLGSPQAPPRALAVLGLGAFTGLQAEGGVLVWGLRGFLLCSPCTSAGLRWVHLLLPGRQAAGSGADRD